ncbi:MAG: hypothetical protein ACOYOP_04920 [Microthrixaceae bacterium]
MGGVAGPATDPRDEALHWAATARADRAELCAALADGSADVADVLARRHEPSVARVRLLTVLEAPAGARKVPTRQLLAELALDPVTPLGALDDATAAVVADRFPVLAP